MSRQFSFVPAGMEEDGDSDELECNFGETMQKNIRKTTENLKMKIVPDITVNAALNGASFDATLPQDTNQWLVTLRQTYITYKKGLITSNSLKQFYASRANPFLDGLKLYANCQTSKTVNSNTLAYIVIEELNAIKMENNIDASPYVDQNLKMVAFNFAKQSNQPTFFKMITNIYELKKDKEMFIDKIKELIAEHNYKDACQFVHKLELFDSFTLFDFLFPLVLQEKMSPVEMYLEDAKHLQHPFVELLDSLLDRSSSVLNICDPYIAKYGYRDLSMQRLQARAMSKVVSRLAKQYNIPEELTPNVTRRKQYGQLQFLLRKNYIEKSLSKESWREMVLEIVPTDSELDLKLELINGCWYNSDRNEATHWARFFAISKDDLPFVLQEQSNVKSTRCDSVRKNTSKKCDPFEDRKYSSNKNERSDEKKEKDDNHDTNDSRFYQLKLSYSNIHLIDERSKFDEMLQYLMAQSIIGFDAEWKPISIQCVDKIALIQFATADRIYLLDVISINIAVNDWNLLATKVFNNPDILKVAFSPTADMKLFQKLMPAFSVSTQILQSSYLDLQGFWQRLTRISGFKFPYEDDEKLEPGAALTTLTHLCFGKPLDKSNQFSNWNNRPLREKQIVYAALDAYCLIEIYEELKNLCESFKLEFGELVHSFLHENRIKLGVNKKCANSPNSSYNGNIPTKLQSAMPAHFSSQNEPKNRPKNSHDNGKANNRFN